MIRRPSQEQDLKYFELSKDNLKMLVSIWGYKCSCKEHQQRIKDFNNPIEDYELVSGVKDKGIRPEIFQINLKVQYIKNHILQIVFQLIFFSGKYRRFMNIFSYAASLKRSSSQFIYSFKQPQGSIAADFPPPAKYIAFVYFIICVLFIRRFSSPSIHF